MTTNNNDYLTITEKGDLFSRAKIDRRRARLEEIRRQLLAPCGGRDDAGAILREKLLARVSVILVQLESLALQQETFERNTRSIEEQIERAQGRWNELPDVTVGQVQSIDGIRQHILSEKAGLLNELRQLRTMHSEHQQRSIAALSDVYTEYASTLRSLAVLQATPLACLPLEDLIDFLVPPTSQGDEEIIILHSPPEVSTVDKRLP
ncbi:MAG: hypothetical protein IT462_11535 [Planctomycetes bacterium]|nr:hypothetical protein [Planctomycetota bacterium]